jgi:activating signal cointegrator complex subunit 3
MMGRAGRPQFDKIGKAVIMVHEPKKNFYKKFLYDPFPVESSLGKVLHDHLNAEIVSGTIQSKQDAIDYLSWTFYFRRLLMNPTYYGLESTKLADINKFLSRQLETVLADLVAARCCSIGEDEMEISSLTLGRIASFYYLSYNTARFFAQQLAPDCDMPRLLKLLCDVTEYDEIPVRHNEEKLNAELAQQLPLPVDARTFDNPHTKVHLLLQAHCSRLELPITDYITDTRSVLDQAIRIVQAMIDVCADAGWLFSTLNCMSLIQMIVQARWTSDSSLLQLPYLTEKHVLALANGKQKVVDAERIDRKE